MKKNDEKEIFRVFYDENAGIVGRFLFAILSDELDAEDLCQEVFLRQWEYGASRVPPTDLLAASLKLFRLHRKRTTDSKYAPLDRSAIADSTTPSGRLRVQWEKLSLTERMAIALTLPGGIPFANAASVLRTDEKALRKRIVRGLLRLGIEKKKQTVSRLPVICAAGEKRILSDQWKTHAEECRKCSRAALLIEEGVRSAERVTAKSFPARTRQRLLRRLQKDLLTLGGTLRYGSISSPIGPIWIGVLEGTVVNVSIAGHSEEEYVNSAVPHYAPRAVLDRKATAPAARELEEYFAGKRKRFTIPYRLVDVSPFQADVLASCARVPFGSVSSYGELAGSVGRPRATRAVGGALGRNPIPLVIPCHRILSSKGRLHGFSGGLESKEKLLALEGRAGLFSGEPEI